MNNVVTSSAVTLARVEVVELVRSASDSAYSVVDIVGLAFRTLGTEVVDEVETRLADASAHDEVLVLGTNRSANTVASLTASLPVALNAVTASDSVVEDLSPGVALTADVVDEVVAGKTPAGPDDGVPHFVVGAGSVTDPVGRVIDFSRRTNSAAVANQVVSFFANTLSVNVVFVGIAGRSAQTEALDVSLVAMTLLCHGAVS